MDDKKLKEYRGEVINRAINVERVVDVFITQYFFKKVNIDFMTKALYDEYFNFGLKINILSKITKDNKLINDLRRLSSIRNLFAHTGLILQEYIDPFDHSKGFITKTPNPKKLEENIEYAELYSEFNILADDLENKLFTVYKENGGNFIPVADE